MGTCPTNTDGSLTPFVAKYCTALGYDMDMLRTMSAQELICAMGAKLNEVVGYCNCLRDVLNNLINLYSEVSVMSDGGLTVGVFEKMPGVLAVPEITGNLPLSETSIKLSDSFSFENSILMTEVLTDGAPSEAFANYGVRCTDIDGTPTITVSAQSGSGTFRIPPQLVPIKE